MAVHTETLTTSAQPLNDVVSSALHTSDNSIPPDVIAIITQNVIQAVRAQLTSPTTGQAVQPPDGIFQDEPGAARSFMSSPTIGKHAVYTPPSPHSSDEFAVESPPQHELEIEEPEPVDDNFKAVHLPRRSHGPDVVFSDSETTKVRPDTIRRTSTDPDATPLEKHWGRLFDYQGNATHRLQSFLQGIALYLIEEMDPKNSLVVTPDKMQKFYQLTSLEERTEVYPWQLVFDDMTSSISRLFRDPSIQVQHHLVQAGLDARPEIPGMTPFGFASWMTLLIKAHPDHEHERLGKVLKVMAINHPEDKVRFPAGITRRLFPKEGNINVATRLLELINLHCKLQISSRHGSFVNSTQQEQFPAPTSPRKSEAPPPPPTVEEIADESYHTDHAPAQEKKAQRTQQNGGDESQNYKAAKSSSQDDDDNSAPLQPIERERKPYVAQPGQGKTHEMSSSGDEKSPDQGNLDLRRTRSQNTGRPRGQSGVSLHQREARSSTQQIPIGIPDVRPRSVVNNTLENSTQNRQRSNSSYADVRPYARVRSRSNRPGDEGPRYHPRRTPSYSQGTADFRDSRATASGDPGYSGYSNSTTAQPSTSFPPPTDRYDNSRPSVSDRERGRDREREQRERDRDREREKEREREHDGRSRTRASTSVNSDNPYVPDYYRSSQDFPHTSAAPGSASIGYPGVYPPSAYREGGR